MALTAAQKQKLYRERKKALPSVTKTEKQLKNANFSHENDTVTRYRALPSSNPDLDLQRQMEEILPELKAIEPDFSKCQPEKPLSPAWCGCEYCKIQAYGAIRIHTENHLLKLEIERLTKELNEKR
jgi:hypothetical protein